MEGRWRVGEMESGGEMGSGGEMESRGVGEMGSVLGEMCEVSPCPLIPFVGTEDKGRSQHRTGNRKSVTRTG